MKKKFTKLTAALALLALFILPLTGWGQTETLKYTLDGTVTGGSSGYADAGTITQNNISWKVMGNTTVNPWRIGGKNLTSENRPIYSTDAISENISKITIEHGTASSITVNSMTVTIHSSAAGAASGSSDIVASFTPTFAANNTVTVTKSDNTSWAGCYYRIVYNVTVSDQSNNKFLQFKNAKFYETASGPVQLAAPTLSAETSDGTVTLSWASIDNASGYNIQYADNSSFTNPTTLSNATSPKEITGLTNGTTYYFKAMTVGDGTNYLSSDYGTAIQATPTNLVWALVSSSNDLVAGDTYVIACNTAGKVAGDISSSVMSSQSATFKNDFSTITSLPDDAIRLTLGTNGSNYTFTNTSNQLLGCTEVKKLAWGSGTTTWNLTFSGTDLTMSSTEDGFGDMKYNSSSPRFTTYASGQTNIQLYRLTGGTQTVATPNISGETPFINSTEVTITCTTEGATIQYSLDDGTTWSNYSTPFTLTETKTVTAKATKSGMTDSAEATKTFTKVTPLANIAALTANTEAGTYYVTLTNAVVTYVSGNYAFIQDASGAVQYYKNGHGLTAGDILNGIATVAYTLNNNNPRITNIENATVTTGGAAPSPTTVAQNSWSYTFNNVLSQYFQITGATLTKPESYYFISLGGENIQLFKNGGSIGTLDLTKSYTVTGFPMLYNTKKEILVFVDPEVEVTSNPTITVTPLTLSNFTYEEGNGPSTAQTISVSGSNLTANITVSLTDGQDSAFELSTSENSGYTNTLTLTQNGGTVAATTIYVRLKENMSILAGGYNDEITLESTSASSITINLTGTVTAPVGPHVTWDLTTASYETVIDPDLVTWSSSYVTMTNATGTSSTPASNYLGGVGEYSHTRFYKNNVLTITPTTGYAISSIEITSTSTDYANKFKNSEWSNATATSSGSIVTITPTNGNLVVSATISDATRATQVIVYYTTSTATAHNVTIDNSIEHGTVVADPTSAIVGTPINLTVTPDAGYYLQDNNIVVDVTGVTITKVNETTYTFTMPDENVTVSAVFTLIPTHVYLYSINGIEGNIEEVVDGTVITLANGTNLNQDFTFAGWTTDANDVSNILAGGSDFTMDDDYEFYAVYAHTITVGNTSSGAKDAASYVRVTSDLGTDWAGDYLIAYSEDKFADGRIGGSSDDGSMGKASVRVDLSESISNNSIPATVGNVYNVTLEEISSGSNTYVLKTKDGKYNYQTENKNGLTCSSNKETAKAYPISVSFMSEDDIRLALGGTATGAVFRFNAGTSSAPATFFRFYKDCGQQPVYLYKYTTGGTPTPQPVSTTSYYTRVFINETVSDNINIAGPSIIPSGQTLNMGESYMVTNNLEATKLIIEDGAQLYSVLGVEAATVQKNIEAYTITGSATETPNGWYFIASPLTTDYTPAGTMIANKFDLYRLNGDQWENFENSAHAADFTALVNGKGYLYANNANSILSFAGETKGYSTVNNANKVDVTAGFNLIGNPYTFNTYINGSFYVMNADRNGVDATAKGGTYAIKPCTGVIVEAAADGQVAFSNEAISNNAHNGNVNMTLSQQVATRGDASSVTLDNAIVSFNEGSQLSKFYFGQSNANIYIPQNGKDYAIVSAEAQGEMPVCFKASVNGSYTLSFDAENVEMGYLHLIDNLTGMDVDLLATPSYSFEAKTSDYASRFRLVFSANNIAESNSENFAFFSDGQLIVTGLTGNETLQLIDALGRILVSTNATERVATDGMTPGVYVVRLVNGSDVKTQKIVVK